MAASAPERSWYNDNLTQLVLMSLVVFAGPGMFNSLNSIGLGGDPTFGNILNTALYCTWMLTSSFAPTIVNILGAKWTLLSGTLGYPVYSLAMYYHQREWAIAAGVFLGLTAGLLWTAQGQLMMSYPEKSRVGCFVAIFWGIFNSGAVLGCLMSFSINLGNSTEGRAASSGGSALSTTTYWTFFGIMCCGTALSMLLLPLNRVTRTSADGVVEFVVADQTEAMSVKVTGMALVLQELSRTAKAFKRPTMLLLIPFMFYSNFFYEYHFGIVGVLFNGRTGSLTAALYWLAQILGSFVLQGFLDREGVSKARRMQCSFVGIVIYIAVTWIFGGYVQYSYGISDERQALDFVGHARSPLMAMGCLFLWGFVDSFVQIWSYWIMSQLSDEPEELACFTAFYKLWQNAGAFVSFLVGLHRSYVLSFWVNVALITISIFPTFLAIRSASRGVQVDSASRPPVSPIGRSREALEAFGCRPVVIF